MTKPFAEHSNQCDIQYVKTDFNGIRLNQEKVGLIVSRGNSYKIPTRHTQEIPTRQGNNFPRKLSCFIFFRSSAYHFYNRSQLKQGFPGGSDGKESACNAGNPGFIPGSERSPGERNGYSFQYSCLGNSMDRGAWWATLHGVSKSSDTTQQL